MERQEFEWGEIVTVAEKPTYRIRSIRVKAGHSYKLEPEHYAWEKLYLSNGEILLQFFKGGESVSLCLTEGDGDLGRRVIGSEGALITALTKNVHLIETTYDY